MEVLLMRLMPYIIAAVVVVSAYFGWEHHVETVQHERDMAAISARDADTERQGKELLKLKQHEADLINQKNQERTKNAIEIYAKRYDDLRRAAADQPRRLPIRSIAPGCNGNTVPGTGEGRPGTGAGTAAIAAGELSESATREFSKVIDRIEEMQLKCERMLNTVTR